jgi:hypothetical protein
MEQHADDHNVTIGFAKADYFDRPPEVDRTYNLDQATKYELSCDWWRETNLSEWYDIG